MSDHHFDFYTTREAILELLPIKFKLIKIKRDTETICHRLEGIKIVLLIIGTIMLLQLLLLYVFFGTSLKHPKIQLSNLNKIGTKLPVI
jgi:hypothetical protein